MKLLKENPWRVSDADFPAGGTDEEKLMFLLNYAVLAPSGHNAQPWLFRISDGEVVLYADRTRALPVVDPSDRELIMSCGAALHHLLVAMRYFGYAPRVRRFPSCDSPDCLASVRLGAEKQPTEEDVMQFEAIKKRRTNRLPFDRRPIPVVDLEGLCKGAAAEHAKLHVFEEVEDKRLLTGLIARGDRIQGADGHFRRELAAWLHPNRSISRDGIPGYDQGNGEMLFGTGPFVVRTFDGGQGRAARDEELAEGSPTLLVLSTNVDTPVAWLAAGQALDCVLLMGTARGLDASFLNQPIEVPELRTEVAELIGGGYPQLILRVGYGSRVKAAPRRPVREVLTSSAPRMLSAFSVR